MYRARVQAVSGSKVFADGKWLKCIGNKPVSVGERVWTDGRVVYGNYTIPQTPLISIPQDETVIPIATAEGYFLFSKGRLKPCKEESLTGYKYFFNDKLANCYLVKNYAKFLTRATLYLRSDYEAYATNQYGINVSRKIVEEDYYYHSWHLEGTLAADVDKQGNFFAIFMDEELTLKIIKNMQTVQTIDLKDLGKEALGKISMPSPRAPLNDWGKDGDPLSPGDFMIWHLYSMSISIIINYAFIESENNWTAYIVFDVSKGVETTHGDWEESLTIGTGAYVNCYLSNHGIELNIADEVTGTSDYTYDYEYTSPEDAISTPDPDYKLPLQDGYYFTEAREDTNAKITIYSPNGQEIFSDSFEGYKIKLYSPELGYFYAYNYSFVSIHAFAKVKGGFLLKIYDNESETYKLYFLGKNRTLLTESACHNARFRPIKKNKKNWVNQIEKISFEN